MNEFPQLSPHTEEYTAYPSPETTALSFRKKILIVDDTPFNREILCNILEDDYDTMLAENGQEALNLLRKQGEKISLILLDIVMPVMNGYQFLDTIKEEPLLCSIPVIVTTASDSVADEIRCLENGASDFVAKPFNPEIVRHRVASIIRLRETSAMLNMLEFDQLTGLYSKEFFYQHVTRILGQHPEKQFDIICSDVESFKLINEQQGIKKGDDLLRYIADKYMSRLKPYEICGRIGADVFAFLTEHRKGYDEEQIAAEIVSGFQNAPVSNFVLKFGVYENVDRTIPVSGMCDRAILALKRIKNQYGKIVAQYDDSLRLSLLREQKILDTMEQALSERQFLVFFQPKNHLDSGSISGAEALVRWIHPEFGFISPADFIPLFEKNGFITKLDFYVWEEVCRMLQQWKASNIPLFPVSVNVSRADFTTPELAQKIERLVDHYGLDHDLLHLEITESAYTDNPQQIIDVVNDLRALGFKIEMDDFGSGYSSLNMLSELSIDILKLDMRLVQQKCSTQKNSILSFIINLAKWLEVDTIAEGVETEEQAAMLKEMGCSCAQGYYYARPMPANQFETYLRSGGQIRPE